MLHEILTERRRSIGMSIDQLVEKSGVPKGTVAKVLTGVSPNPALETVRSIAYALGLTLNDLVEGNTPELSAKALKVARAYDAMSDYGKSMIDKIVENESKYMITKIVPRLEHLTGIKVGHDSDIQAKYNAKQELKELSEEQNRINQEKI